MATRLGGLQTEQCAGTRISLNAIRECCVKGSLRSAHFLHDESVNRTPDVSFYVIEKNVKLGMNRLRSM